MYKVPLGFTIELFSDGTGSVDIDIANVPIAWRLAGPIQGSPQFEFPRLNFPDSVFTAHVPGFTLLTASLPSPGLLRVLFSGSGPPAGAEVTLSGSFLYNSI